MAFQLTPAQYDELSSLLNSLPDPTTLAYDPDDRSGYSQLYQQILDDIEVYKETHALTNDEERVALCRTQLECFLDCL